MGAEPGLEGATVCDKSVAPRDAPDAEAWCQRAPTRTAGHSVAYRFVVKRRLLIAAIFLLAGAVVNVAVIFGLLTWATNALPAAEEELAIAQWPQPVPAEWPKLDSADRIFILGRTEIWAEGHDNQHDYHQRLSQVGWPLLCIEGEALGYYPIWNDRSTDLVLMTQEPYPVGRPYRSTDPGHGVQPPAWLGDLMMVRITDPARIMRIRLLPTRFAVNTIFYAALLWLPFVVRRFSRARRGLCPKCAYPMAESPVCTECGKPLPGRAKVAT